MMLVRLLATAAMWLFIVAVALEVVVLWAVIILPIQFLARRRRAEAQPAPSPAPGNYSPPTSTIPFFAAGGATTSREVLDSLPDPGHSPALSNCAMCGGSTAGVTADCLFCGSPLSMIPTRGWHLDPLKQGERRWHDGDRWTSHVGDGL
ncbi:MAG: hypothetical protein ACR2MB_10805 [Acidimicrobiales bacterium]